MAIDLNIIIPFSIPIALIGVLIFFAYGKRGDELVPAETPAPTPDVDELPYTAVREGVIQ